MQVQKNVEIITVAGTRPEIIKLSKLIKLLGRDNHAFLYTGQHYSTNMKEVFLEELQVNPDYDLECNTSETEVIKDRMLRFLRNVSHECIIVYGDTSSSLAGALAAKELNSKLIHVEAGLRCFDLTVPEEKIRMQIDSISDYLLAPTDLSKTFLKHEGTENNVFVTGNLVVDVCKELSEAADRYQRYDLPEEYLLLTLHRQETVEDQSRLSSIKNHLEKLNYKIIFPLHPRTRNSLSRYGITLPENVITINPVGYVEFLYLLKNSKLVLTDSGGVQEEAAVLKKPCITLRNTTERWETILQKSNVLFPTWRTDSLADVVETMLSCPTKPSPYGENVAEKCADIIRNIACATRTGAAA